MITEKNKKILSRHSIVTLIFVFLATGSFLFGKNVLAYTGDYNKAVNGSLSASEWNNLINDFVAIYAGGNAGIGTTTPSAKLDIWGNLRTDSGNFITDGAGNLTFESFFDKSNVLYKMDLSNTGTSLNAAGNIFSTGGIIGTSGTGNNYFMGAVGIGTTTPGSFKLNVTGDVQLNNLTFVNPGVGGDSRITFSKSSDAAWLSVKELSSDTTEYGFNMSDNPDQPGDMFYWKMSDWQGVGGAWRPLQFNGLNAQIAAANINAYGNYNVYGPWYSSDGVPNTIYSLKTGSINLTPNLSGYTGTTGVYWFKIDGIGSPNTFSWGRGSTGSVAVATGVPVSTSPMTIENGLRVTFSATTGGAMNDLWQFRVYSGGNMRVANGSASLPSISFTGDNNTGLYLNGTDQLGFSTGGINRMIVNSVGDVGIGTSTPTTARLVIAPSGTYSIDAGNGRIGNLGTPALDTDAATVAYVKSIAAGTSSVPTVGYWTASSTHIFNANSGNIGIGTNNPGQKLQVNGSILIGSSGSLYFNDTGTAIGIPSANSISFTTSGTERIRISNTGSVGIGTTTPSASLDIFGKLKFTSAGTIYNTDSTRYLDMTGVLTDSLKISGNIYTTAGLFKSDSTGNNYMLGNLGIGTATPTGARLDVNGLIKMRVASTSIVSAEDVVNKGYVDSQIITTVGSINTMAKFFNVTNATYYGNNTLFGAGFAITPGYTQADAACNNDWPGTHVCTSEEILNTIRSGGSMPPNNSVVWIQNGPPGYTTEANDCDGRTSNRATSYSAVWQMDSTKWPNGRGMLTVCSNYNKFACCK